MKHLIEIQDKLFSHALKLTRHWHDAEDLWQDVNERLIKRASSYDFEKGTYITWALTLMDNYYTDWTRSAAYTKKRKTLLAPFAKKDYRRFNNVTELTRNRDTYKNLRLAIRSLKSNKQRAVMLLRLYGFKLREIAVVMDMSLLAVKSTIFRANKKIQLHYEKAN